MADKVDVLADGDLVTDPNGTYVARFLRMLDEENAYVEVLSKKQGVVMPKRFAVPARHLLQVNAALGVGGAA